MIAKIPDNKSSVFMSEPPDVELEENESTGVVVSEPLDVEENESTGVVVSEPPDVEEDESTGVVVSEPPDVGEELTDMEYTVSSNGSYRSEYSHH